MFFFLFFFLVTLLCPLSNTVQHRGHDVGTAEVWLAWMCCRCSSGGGVGSRLYRSRACHGPAFLLLDLGGDLGRISQGRSQQDVGKRILIDDARQTRSGTQWL